MRFPLDSFLLCNTGPAWTKWESLNASDSTSERYCPNIELSFIQKQFWASSKLCFLSAYTFKLKGQRGEISWTPLSYKPLLTSRREAEYVAKRPPVDCLSPAMSPGPRISISQLRSTSFFNCSHLWTALVQEDASPVFMVPFCFPKPALFWLRMRSVRDQKGVFLTRTSACSSLLTHWENFHS